MSTLRELHIEAALAHLAAHNAHQQAAASLDTGDAASASQHSHEAAARSTEAVGLTETAHREHQAVGVPAGEAVETAAEETVETPTEESVESDETPTLAETQPARRRRSAEG